MSLVLVMSTFLKYEARSSVETRWRSWCDKGGERKVTYLVSGKNSLPQKDGHLSGDSERLWVLRELRD